MPPTMAGRRLLVFCSDVCFHAHEGVVELNLRLSALVTVEALRVSLAEGPINAVMNMGWNVAKKIKGRALGV